MAEQTLRITFSGICTHFKNIVPGVPHRVVLPNASGVRFGLIAMPGADKPNQAYYLMPHVALLRSYGETSGIVALARNLLGARLHLLNACDGAVSYAPSYEKDGYPLKRYVPHFDFSEEVVFGGRAAGYFDVFQGTVSSHLHDKGARYTMIDIKTDGPPKVRVIPFPGSAMTQEDLPIDSGNLEISNLDYDPSDEDTNFDFLLNYLVARTGIPAVLTELTPGLKADEPPLGTHNVARRLNGLAAMIAAGGALTEEALAALPPGRVVLTPSCSDSRYP